MTKERKIIYIGALALVTVLFVLGGIFDLSISNAIYQPDNIVANVFESVGPFPPFMIVSATFAMLFFCLDENKKDVLLKKIVCVALAALSYFVFGFMASETYLTSLLYRALVALGSAAILTPLTFFALRNVGEDKKKRLLVVLIFGSIVAVLSSLISVNVLKFIWGRPRYREMMAQGEGIAAFAPWFKINGFSLHGHHSFPSGHTCAASNLFIFCAIGEVFPSDRSREWRIGFIATLYTFIMAYSRIVIGAHFLSDVTAGFFIGFLTYAVARYFFFRKFGAAINGENEEVVVTETAEANDLDDPNKIDQPERVEIEVSFENEEIELPSAVEIITEEVSEEVGEDEVERIESVETIEAVRIILPSENEDGE